MYNLPKDLMYFLLCFFYVLLLSSSSTISVLGAKLSSIDVAEIETNIRQPLNTRHPASNEPSMKIHPVLTVGTRLPKNDTEDRKLVYTLRPNCVVSRNNVVMKAVKNAMDLSPLGGELRSSGGYDEMLIPRSIENNRLISSLEFSLNSGPLRNSPCTVKNTWLHSVSSGSLESNCLPQAVATHDLYSYFKDDECITSVEYDTHTYLASGDYYSTVDHEGIDTTEQDDDMYVSEFLNNQSKSDQSQSKDRNDSNDQSDRFEGVDEFGDLQFDPSAVTPNDKHFPLQWEYKDTNYGIKAQTAWETAVGGKGTQQEQPKNVVGVVDVSFLQSHPDLKDKWAKNKNEICGNNIDDDGNGLVDDCYGWNFADNNNNLMIRTNASEEDDAAVFWHGTAVGGCAGAETENNIGIASICPNCLILPMATSLFTSEILLAINYLLSMNVTVINFSFGGRESPAIKQAIAANMGKVLFVVAAGNSGCDMDNSPSCRRYSYPAANSDIYKNVISVGSHRKSGTPSVFSNIGITRVQVFAPGEVISTSNVRNKPVYAGVQGTSFASPIVAGLATLMQQKYPQLTPCQLRIIIMASCTRLDTMKGRVQCGGYINAARALALAATIDPTINPACSRRRSYSYSEESDEETRRNDSSDSSTSIESTNSPESSNSSESRTESNNREKNNSPSPISS